MKLGQGNIFPSMCPEFCPHGGRVSASVHAGIHSTPSPGPGRPPGSITTPPDQADPPGSRHPPDQAEPPPPQWADIIPPDQADPPGSRHPPDQADPPQEADSSIRSTSGRYASYWNAFLFVHFKKHFWSIYCCWIVFSDIDCLIYWIFFV